MGQGGTDASDAGSARGRVRDEDQTVILPRVDAVRHAPTLAKHAPTRQGTPRTADKARRATPDQRPRRRRSEARRGRRWSSMSSMRMPAPDLAKEFLAQEMLAQDLLADVPWPDDNAAYAGERPAAELATSLASGLATFPYLGRTIRRRARVWCIFGVVGLALGLGLHYVKPPPAKASTSVELTYPPASNAIGRSHHRGRPGARRTVAGLAENELGLTENVNKFLASYTATYPTDRIIVITASAPTPSEATSRADDWPRCSCSCRPLSFRPSRQGSSTSSPTRSTISTGRSMLTTRRSPKPVRPTPAAASKRR